VKRHLRVLDSYSVIAYLENETGAKRMIELFKEARDSANDVLLCLINWGEIYYITRRELGPDRAEEVATLLTSLPIEIVGVDFELTKAAAELKSKHRMSYADCFAAALARSRSAKLVTGDPEFREVAGEVTVEWID
jgi:ribonuclease VapC